MFINVKQMKGYALSARDGDIGKVKEFYFDDQYWTIRYLVAETGSWLTGRKVLIAPYAMGSVSEELHEINVDLTKKQIENSPSLDQHKPVSLQFQESYYNFFGWPTYWSGSYMWGAYPDIVRDPGKWRRPSEIRKNQDPNLRSTHSVTGHHIQATDGEIGHVFDFVVDTDNWSIRYLIVETGNWLSGKKVLISPQWIERVSWAEETVYVNVSRSKIEHSDDYNENIPIDRDYEFRLYRSYGLPNYWTNESPQ